MQVVTVAFTNGACERTGCLHRNVVAPHADAPGIEPRLPGADVEFPAMPGTAQDFATPRDGVVAWSRRGDEPTQRADAEGAALVRATIAQGEELASNVEDADGTARDLDDLALTRRDLVDTGDNVPARCLLPASLPRGALTPTGNLRSSLFLWARGEGQAAR